jgi:predicted dehydrogenase
VVEDRALVVGAGSIGLRHQHVLTGLGIATDLVSRRPELQGAGQVQTHADLGSALQAVAPAYVVLAMETAAHLPALEELARNGFRGRVLVEKPLTAAPLPAAAAAELRTLPFLSVAVGYQLRFHPAVTAARAHIGGDRIVAIDAYVGQHLAAWRPGRSVDATASARIADGGGVLRDLSHELDLVTWLAGRWSRVCAVGGRSGTLGVGVETDDRWAIVLELEDGAVATVHLNALDHVGQRRLTLIGSTRSVAVDLIASTVARRSVSEDAGGPATVEQYPADRDDVLAAMHSAVLEGDLDALCSLDAGMALVQLIDAIERSAALGSRIAREDMP